MGADVHYYDISLGIESHAIRLLERRPLTKIEPPRVAILIARLHVEPQVSCLESSDVKTLHTKAINVVYHG